MELWAAMIEVEVMYSLMNIGASVNCSANEKTVETAPATTGLATVDPPNKVWSTIVVVMPTAVLAIPRVTAKPKRVPDFTAPNAALEATDAKSNPCLLYSTNCAIADRRMSVNWKEEQQVTCGGPMFLGQAFFQGTWQKSTTT